MQIPSKRREKSRRKFEAFAQSYVRTGNAAQAAIDAGYKPKNRNAASQQGYLLLRYPEVKARVEELRQVMSASQIAKRDTIMSELTLIGTSDVTQVVKIVGGKALVADTDELSESTRRAIKSIQIRETKEGQQISVQMHDKVPALQLAGNALGLYKPSEDPEGGGPQFHVHIHPAR